MVSFLDQLLNFICCCKAVFSPLTVLRCSSLVPLFQTHPNRRDNNLVSLT